MKLLIIIAGLMFSTQAFCHERIISLGGTLTEIVFALGEGSKVVGVDGTSVYPPEAQKIAKVGRRHDVSMEGILSQKPDLVLVSSVVANPTLLAQLKDSKLKFELIPDEISFANAKEKITQIAKILGKEKAGKLLVDELTADLSRAQTMKKDVKAHKVLFIYARGASNVFAAGKETPASVMIEESGATNAFGAVSGFKPVSSESLIGSNPEAVIFLKSGMEGLGDGLWKTPGLAETIAGKKKNLIVVDDAAFLGFGPRSGKELIKLIESVKKL